MSQLRIFDKRDADQVLLDTHDGDEIANALGALGVRFERWRTTQRVDANAGNDTILDAYATEIQKLVSSGEYQSYDVISLTADHPDKIALRQKFLHEHTHSEDEVRFFVRGEGLFCLHMQSKVLQLLCQQDDLISVPAGTKHWFDMGANPNFTCIRVFSNPEGWIAQPTGDDIAAHFPLMP